jgi:hypothetical protein
VRIVAVIVFLFGLYIINELFYSYSSPQKALQVVKDEFSCKQLICMETNDNEAISFHATLNGDVVHVLYTAKKRLVGK